MHLKKGWAALAASVGLMVAGSAAWADKPRPWEMNFQEPASPVMHEIVGFHNELLVIITAITLFVLALLIYVVVRFDRKRNPNPTRTAHNTPLEVAWTVIPVLILVFIAIPSFKLLYFANVVPSADMTLKVTGHQWYWSYVYPDDGNIAFDAILKCRTAEDCSSQADAAGNEPIRLLDTDNFVVLPVDTTVRVQLTSDDVIHSWAVPSLGVKMDSIPGRLNETWLKIEREGTYYGQCSELCGIDHGYMPIAIKAVSKEAFADWAKQQAEAAKTASAATGAKQSPPAATQVAHAGAN
ncbi:MAG: cytochrome c oxidase subunit II [Alphaproteobacteria bacterium]